ncbi:MAG: cytidylate kinase [Methanosaeta sp. PtaB.Bin018]|jgi:cytidylate kinase|nr:AAA family ATPase [Methanothrix sp.]OPX75994.1 MAG: cytidylate kinase [Methanosaeta sp. PtaB.Bin018]OPY43989.1 MAG: cytidylate kinase [Methanosaeta sp. PtaU1.Bin016]HOV52806.1 AAA family ATPase [Methanothrix sp.]
MIITISGAPGTGTSTLARSLAAELGLRWVNSGDLFRKIASEKNISVKDMNRLAEKGPEIDYLIDDAQKTLAKDGSGIFEGRLSGHLLSADLKVLLKTDLRTRAERISKRESKLLEDAMQETRIREESEARRYKMYYNIDINDYSGYDLVVDTGRFNEAGTLAVVLAAVRACQ